MLNEVLDRILVDDFCLVDSVDLVVLDDKTALFINRLFDVGQGVLNRGDPLHVNNLFMELAGQNVLALVVVCHVGGEVVGSKVGAEVLLHVFVGAVILIKIFQNGFTSFLNERIKRLWGCRFFNDIPRCS